MDKKKNHIKYIVIGIVYGRQKDLSNLNDFQATSMYKHAIQQDQNLSHVSCYDNKCSLCRLYEIKTIEHFLLQEMGL